MNQTKPTIRIDVVSDVVCPWCYIGKRRIEKAMDALSGEFNFEVEYHPFELNPQMPVSGTNQKQYLSDKFGGDERYEQITNHTTQVAAQEGLTFDFGKQHVSPNTRMVHSIIQLAKLEGKHQQAVEAFFKAYFTDGIDLSKKENLEAVAKEIGLTQSGTEKLFADPKALAQVAATEHEMSKLGITGVPFYIINNKYGVSGAQASETFMKAFRDIEHENQTAAVNACNVDGSDC